MNLTNLETPTQDMLSISDFADGWLDVEDVSSLILGDVGVSLSLC